MTGALRAAIQEPTTRPPRRRSRELELRSQIDKLFRRLRLAVVFAGDRSVDGAVIERTSNPRSWKSYETVAHDIAAAMERLGCRDIIVLPDDMRLGDKLREHGTHIAWLNTGGVQGHCSIAHAPAMLELFGIPYIGHDQSPPSFSPTNTPSSGSCVPPESPPPISSSGRREPSASILGARRASAPRSPIGTGPSWSSPYPAAPRCTWPMCRALSTSPMRSRASI